MPYRLNDIVNTEYDAGYKKQLEKAVLDLLSAGYQKNITPEGMCDVSTLHDIGGINKDGSVIENSQENGVSQVVITGRICKTKKNERKHTSNTIL